MNDANFTIWLANIAAICLKTPTETAWKPWDFPTGHLGLTDETVAPTAFGSGRRTDLGYQEPDGLSEICMSHSDVT